MLKLALVGRPNVGKSTLYNRLAKKKLAIVNDTPGVTRDWREADGYLFDQHIRIIDTAGLEENFDDSIQGRMRRKTEEALNHCNAILFIIDGRSGLTPLDEHFATFLRRQKKPVILCLNKSENEKAVASALGEAYRLGFGEPVPISAEHGSGMEHLYQLLEPYFGNDEDTGDTDEEDTDEFDDIDDLEGKEDFEFQQEEDSPEKPIKVAIIGRPNVGKSTLLNAILGEERSMTGPEAGITRDAVAVDWEVDGRAFKLVDTAGMRRRSKVQDPIEKMSVDDSLRAIRLAQVVVLVLDSNTPLEKQDLQIAEHIINEGRALVIAMNKWDTITNKDEVLELLEYKMDKSMGAVRGVRIQPISALRGRNLNKLFRHIVDTYALWNKRIPTGKLNRWLAGVESRNPAPLSQGRQNRLKFIAQIKTRPPTFAIWVSRPQDLPASYRRYVINCLREDYDLPATPIRLLVRTSKNPYA